MNSLRREIIGWVWKAVLVAGYLLIVLFLVGAFDRHDGIDPRDRPACIDAVLAQVAAAREGGYELSPEDLIDCGPTP